MDNTECIFCLRILTFKEGTLLSFTSTPIGVPTLNFTRTDIKQSSKLMLSFFSQEMIGFEFIHQYTFLICGQEFFSFF